MDNVTSPQAVPLGGASQHDAENGNGSASNEEQQQQQASFLQQQQQQQQQNAQFGGLPFALMGASPLQQQLSSLAGFGAAPPTLGGGGGQPFSQGFLPNTSSISNQLLQGLNPQLLQQLGIATQAPLANSQLQLQQQLLGTSQDQTNASDPQQLLDTAANQILGNPQQQQQQLPQAVPQQTGLNNLQQLQLMLMTNPQMFQGAGANLLAFMGQPPPQQQQQFFQLPGLTAPAPPVNMNSFLQASAPNTGSLFQNTSSSNINDFKSNEPAAPPKSSTEMEWAEPFAGKSKKEPPFPLKLHQILSNPEFSECICWNNHGRSWRILKPPVFEQIVIPLYFRHAKYASFMRQVNGWGFKRIVSGNDHNSYYHELFQRDAPDLCVKMKRVKKAESHKAKKDKGAADDGSRDEQGSKDETQEISNMQDQMNAQPTASSMGHTALQAALQNLQGGASGLSGLNGLHTGLPGAPLDAQSALAGLIGSAGAALAPRHQQIDLGGVGALNMAAPGLSALAGLGQAATTNNNPTALAGGQQRQPEQQATSSATSPDPPVAAAPASPPASGLAGLDSAILAKLLQQTQMPNASLPGAPSGLEFLTSQINGGLNASAGLAAQLQAATRPPPAAAPANNGGSDDDSDDDDDDDSGEKNKDGSDGSGEENV